MLQLYIFHKDSEGTIDQYFEVNDVIKNITLDEKLNTGLESTSNLMRVTIPRDYEHTLDIIIGDDFQAELRDGNTTFFTGWVSTSFQYTIDTHGQQALQITLEDNGTHLLKTPFTKTESVVISGKFSSITTGDYGVVQQICEVCGISWTSNIKTNTTIVETVAEPAETCEDLLKSVCKEMGYVYSFNALGQLYLAELSTDDISDATPVIQDNALYDSIKLTRKASSNRGSRITYKKLSTRTNTLVYRDISKPSGSTAPDCYIELDSGESYPSPDGVASYIQATDLASGAEVFSISNVSPTLQWTGGIIPNYTITGHGADALSVLVTGRSHGYITKLEARADLRYVASTEVIYGNGELVTESLQEEECRWIHDDSDSNHNPATRFANFVAQYNKYSSRSFTFSTKNTYEIGQIIRLHEQLHTGLSTYMMITRRTRTLVGYDETNKVFKGVWTYDAVSTSEFDYDKTVTEESLYIPPSDSYVNMPSVISTEDFQLTALTDMNQSFLTTDLRDQSGIISSFIRANTTGGISVEDITISVSDNNGNIIPYEPQDSLIPRVDFLSAQDYPGIGPCWQLTAYHDGHDSRSTNPSKYVKIGTYNVTGTVGTGQDAITHTISIPVEDQTQYYKFLGNFANDSDANSNAGVIIIGDFYLNTTTGVTRECYAIVRNVPTWREMTATTADNAEKLLRALESATQAGVALETMSDPNTVSWFNTIIAAKAVIDNLFSRYITILNDGCIHSTAYSDSGVWDGVNKGFYLGSDGTFNCDSAYANHMTIAGDSVFQGKFNTGVLNTLVNPTSHTDFPSNDTWSQAKVLCSGLQNAGYPMGSYLAPTNPIRCDIKDVTSAVYYVNYYMGGGSYQIHFWDKDLNELNIRNIVTCTKNGGNYTNYLWSSDSGSLGQWVVGGITLRVYTGGNLLEVYIPDQDTAGGNPANTLFTGPQITINNIPCRAVYMRV